MGDLPKKMHGFLLTGHGGMERLVYKKDIPVPGFGPSDVLIRVAAAGVNNTDINTRIGWYSKKNQSDKDASWSGKPMDLPRIQGADVCGHIAAVGSQISRDRIGERVLVEPCLREANGSTLSQPWYLGSECDGGFAQFTVVASRHAHKINSRFSDIELASFPCSYSTAENLLTRAGVKKGDRVLITGASGGVGSAAVQLAKARKAHVIAITSSAKSDAVRDLGADQILFRENDLIETLGANSVDVVIDLVAGDQWPQFLDILQPDGRYAVAGAIAGPHVQLDVRTLYLKDISMFGCTALDPHVFENLIKLIEQEKIIPVVAQAFDLKRIHEAQKMFLDKKFVGKIVLSI